jgi:hypothetical protein
MKKAASLLALATLALPVSYGQSRLAPDTDGTGRTATTVSATGAILRDDAKNSSPAAAPAAAQNQSGRLGVEGKFRYYLGETYFNPSLVTAPAFRAGLRMANPPSHFPADWRQGAGAFGRNYGDAMAQRLSFQTARFAAGALIREDPRYAPSSSHNAFARSLHALDYTFIDRSDSGHRMPAVSNFVGAAAAGFVGNAYLPSGFANLTHAGQRAALQLGFFGAGNLYREFAPQMPKPVRIFFELIGR